jgi:hypothetical protein
MHPGEEVPHDLAALHRLVGADRGPGHVVGEVVGEVAAGKQGVQEDRMVSAVASTDMGAS